MIYYSRYLSSKLCIDIRNRVNCVKYYMEWREYYFFFWQHILIWWFYFIF